MLRSKRRNRRSGNPAIVNLGIATRFQPGQSGNPGGRPKTRVLAEMLASVGSEIDKKSGKTFFQLAAESLVENAFHGDVQAFKEFADRIDGRAAQPVELTGANGRPIAFQSEMERELLTATPERRRQLAIEIDDQILQVAAEILENRRPTSGWDKRYKDRMAEFHGRIAAGEDAATVLATFKTPPAGEKPAN
jgi:hypothetical protein